MEKIMRLRKSSLLMSLLALLFTGLLTCAAVGDEIGKRMTVELSLGQSKIITMPVPFKRVAIAAPEIADILVLSPMEAFINGKMPGYTSIILWEEGKDKTMLDVIVSLNLTGLKEKFHTLFPDQQIEVYGTETGIVLSGIVSGPEIVEQAIRLAQAYMPAPKGNAGSGKEQEGGTGMSSQSMRITNLLKVSGIQQVMLEVKFAEINRTKQKDIQTGIGQGGLDKITGAIGVGNVLSPIELTGPNLGHLPADLVAAIKDIPTQALVQNQNSLLVNLANGTPNIFVNIRDFTASLEFLENEGLARILAEPRLVTMSGHEASFLAGGEFPIPVANDRGSITITFKQFGIGLVFTPTILSSGKISLRVAPSVSEIASTSVIPAGIQGTNFNVPNLSTRKLETTVELFDGQSLALAGLLQDNLRETVAKIPGLGNIPILGILFRSSSYLESKTDLLVAVTPHLVKPVDKEEIVLPGENLIPPNSYQFYLEGRLEGNRPAGATESGGLEGEFGHQPISSDGL